MPAPLPLETPRDLARAISRVERGGSDAEAAMRSLGPRPPRARVIGITGPPGGGKSTLVDRLTAAIRADGHTVGIIAIDPSSPFSGGAILGDRVRMVGHSGDAGVFVRSMAARDNLGGLAAASRDAARLMDAYGFDIILVETVGVGQSELDVVKVADSMVVIAVPGLGDTIQTLKAGIMEIGDVFAVNMADRAGAERTVAEIRSMLGLGASRTWSPPVLETVATEGRGIDALWDALKRHHKHLEASGELAERRRRRVETEVLELVERRLRLRLRERQGSAGTVAALLDAARSGALDAHTAAARIVEAEFGVPLPRAEAAFLPASLPRAGEESTFGQSPPLPRQGEGAGG